MHTKGTKYDITCVLADGSLSTPKYWCKLPVLIAPGLSINLPWLLLPKMNDCLIGSRTLYAFGGSIDYGEGRIHLSVGSENVAVPFAFGVGTNPFARTPSLMAMEDVTLGPNELRDINVEMAAEHTLGFHNQMLEFRVPAGADYLCQNAVLPVHKDRNPFLKLQLANPSMNTLVIPKGTAVAYGRALDLDSVKTFVGMDDADEAAPSEPLANMRPIDVSAGPAVPAWTKEQRMAINKRWENCPEVQEIDLSTIVGVSEDIVTDLKRRILDESYLFVQGE